MGSLFSAPKAPKIEAPTKMPDKKDPAKVALRARRVEELRRRGGRESTILSGRGGKLGAG